MDNKRYQEYLDYLCKLQKYSNWVLRDNPYLEYFQLTDYRKDTFSEILRLEAYEIVLQAIFTLLEREQKVLLLRYGFIDNKPLTLNQVGDILNITRERVRQIEARALRSLRHPSRAEKLRLLY